MADDPNMNEDRDAVGEQPAGETDAVSPSRDAEVAKVTAELDAYKDKYVRLYAEFENARKRMEREKNEFVKYANEGIIVEFLEVVDNLERCIAVAKAKHQDYDAFLKGIEMVMANVADMLKKNGVVAIEAKDKPFDPHCEEVLLQEPSDTVEEGVVMEELQKGYYLGDRVVRTAKVKVASKK
jgi:molecular chaperone GrpE